MNELVKVVEKSDYKNLPSSVKDNRPGGERSVCHEQDDPQKRTIRRRVIASMRKEPIVYI